MKIKCEDIIVEWLLTQIGREIHNSMMNDQIYQFATRLGLSAKENYSTGTYERQLRKVSLEKHLLEHAGLELLKVDTPGKKEQYWRVVKSNTVPRVEVPESASMDSTQYASGSGRVANGGYSEVEQTELFSNH